MNQSTPASTTARPARRWLAFHVLRPLPPSRMNRGELGDPKNAMFGGVSRLMLSSQAQKYAWRKALGDTMGPYTAQLGLRTRQLPKLVAATLAARGAPPALADGVRVLLRTLGKAESAPSAEAEPDTQTTSAILFLAREEIDAVVAFAEANRDAFLALGSPPTEEAAADAEEPSEGEVAPDGDAAPKTKGKAKGKAKGKKSGAGVLDQTARLAQLREKFGPFIAERAPRPAPDVALLGRFLTTEELPSVRAALRVAFALGVEAYQPDFDFFTTKDDCDPDGPSAHMGQVAMGAATVYQYLDLAASTFVDAIQDRAMAAATASALARVVALVTPGGAENSTAPHTPPAYLEIHVHAGPQPLNLAEAFVAPIRPTASADVLTQAIDRLRAHAARVQETLYAPGEVIARYTFCPGARDLPVCDGETRLATLAELCATVATLVETAP